MMADDPTVTQPMPVSMREARNFAELVQALELLQLNMVRTLQHRERLAEIVEGVAKINHDIRNVLSSATLVSDALLASDDDNVRKSAPLVLRSLQQAVDLCQSMLDYLAQTPAPVYADFDLVKLLEEVKTATLLDIDFCGPTTMHADRGMMFRILLNLGRNAGAAGASKLTIEIWRAGHLAIFDISDNGSGIPRHL
jgi:signal transduction histidine kinase